MQSNQTASSLKNLDLEPIERLTKPYPSYRKARQDNIRKAKINFSKTERDALLNGKLPFSVNKFWNQNSDLGKKDLTKALKRLIEEIFPGVKQTRHSLEHFYDHSFKKSIKQFFKDSIKNKYLEPSNNSFDRAFSSAWAKEAYLSEPKVRRKNSSNIFKSLSRELNRDDLSNSHKRQLVDEFSADYNDIQAGNISLGEVKEEALKNVITSFVERIGLYDPLNRIKQIHNL